MSCAELCGILLPVLLPASVLVCVIHALPIVRSIIIDECLVAPPVFLVCSGYGAAMPALNPTNMQQYYAYCPVAMRAVDL
jgi:hypothetical protein